MPRAFVRPQLLVRAVRAVRFRSEAGVDVDGRAAVGAVTVSGRVGRPEDIGAACIYLASRAGSYVTGAVLPVDGGLLVGTKANS